MSYATNILQERAVLVLTEEQRHRLMQANRERIMALPDDIDAEFMPLPATLAAGVRVADKSDTP